MKILVVGGAGYIGSHVVLDLLNRGHMVSVLDNLSAGLRINLFEKAQFIHGDLSNRVLLTQVLGQGFDAVVHLAAYKAAGESMMNPQKYSENNIAGTIGLLSSMLETGVNKFVFSSSAAVYGEPQYLPMDEEHPKNPENFYGFTKLKIEEILGWYNKIHSLQYCALRYFNAAGYDPEGRVKGLETNPANLLPITMEAAKGWRKELVINGEDYETRDGTCIRDYVHVSDLALAHSLGIETLSQGKSALAFNLGSEVGISVKEMAEAAQDITKIAFPVRIGPRRPGDPAVLTASSKKAKEVLGWEASHSSLEELIKSTWRVYENQ